MGEQERDVGIEVKQLFHHCNKWEEIKAGMWRTLDSEARVTSLENAVKLMMDASQWGKWMLRVLERWPISCEQNLSNLFINRRAWLGQAACCLAVDCPEDVTREAWGRITVEQQQEANAVADFAVARWESWYAQETDGG